MAGTVIASTVLHALVGTAAPLWLLWFFIPVSNLSKSAATLLIGVLLFAFVLRTYRRHAGQGEGLVASSDVPNLSEQGPLVLVCGDGLDDVFQQQSHIKTAQGDWLRVDDVSQLTDVVRAIQMKHPRQVGQLSVMYFCLPDCYQDDALLRAPLKTLRQQIHQLNVLTGRTLPVVLNCECRGPDMPWIVIRGDTPIVSSTSSVSQALADWLQTEQHAALLPIVSQLFALVRESLCDELEKTDRLYPSAPLFAVAVRTGAQYAQSMQEQNAWSHRLYQHTALWLSPLPQVSNSLRGFPYAVLPLLAPFAIPMRGGQRTRRVALLLWLCGLAALGLSVIHNRDLIRQVGADLQRWQAIPMMHDIPKAQALSALNQDVLQLEHWQQQGTPARFGVGYYPGHRLWLVLQQAIDTYVPPPAPVIPSNAEPVPSTVRLDSMSLFDTGQAVLKEASTNVLVNALVGIKAKPGWLIVISGHTDGTGSQQLNQVLSLQRAEAVRNWMRDVGGVPEHCFAVQGNGDSRPVASNDSPDGRARNRRVEISLVPQADACRIPDVTLPLSQTDDGIQN